MATRRPPDPTAVKAAILADAKLSLAQVKATDDEAQLMYVAKLCGAEASTPTEWASDVFKLSFDRAGVRGFTDLLLLFDKTINELGYYQVPPGGTTATRIWEPIPPVKIVLLRYFLHLYHQRSRLKGQNAHPLMINKTTLNALRAKASFDPHSEIVPWNVPDAKAKDEKRAWERSIKRNPKDFPVLRKDAHWLNMKERFIDCAKAQGVYDILEPSEEDKEKARRFPEVQQQKYDWLFNVMLSHSFQTTSTLDIIKAQRDTKNVPEIWKTICQKLENSVTADATANILVQFLTSVNFARQAWKGTMESQVNHFNERLRQHNEMVPKEDQYKGKQAIRLLRIACLNSPLETVWNTYHTNIRATGSTEDISYEDYYALILDAAQTKDNAISNRRRVNWHEFDSQEDTKEDPAQQQLMANLHYLDSEDPDEELGTSFEQSEHYQVYQSHFGEHKSNAASTGRLSSELFGSLADEDRRTWSMISKDGRIKIITSLSKTDTTGSVSKAQRESPKSSSKAQRKANQHSVEGKEEDQGEDDDSKTQISAHVHESSKTSAVDVPEEPGILEMLSVNAATRTVNPGDIRAWLSETAAKKVTDITELRANVHETTEKGERITYSVNMASGNYDLEGLEELYDDEEEEEQVPQTRSRTGNMRAPFHNVPIPESKIPSLGDPHEIMDRREKEIKEPVTSDHDYVLDDVDEDELLEVMKARSLGLPDPSSALVVKQKTDSVREDSRKDDIYDLSLLDDPDQERALAAIHSNHSEIFKNNEQELISDIRTGLLRLLMLPEQRLMDALDASRDGRHIQVSQQFYLRCYPMGSEPWYEEAASQEHSDESQGDRDQGTREPDTEHGQEPQAKSRPDGNQDSNQTVERGVESISDKYAAMFEASKTTPILRSASLDGMEGVSIGTRNAFKNRGIQLLPVPTPAGADYHQREVRVDASQGKLPPTPRRSTETNPRRWENTKNIPNPSVQDDEEGEFIEVRNKKRQQASGKPSTNARKRSDSDKSTPSPKTRGGKSATAPTPITKQRATEISQGRQKPHFMTPTTSSATKLAAATDKVNRQRPPKQSPSTTKGTPKSLKD